MSYVQYIPNIVTLFLPCIQSKVILHLHVQRLKNTKSIKSCEEHTHAMPLIAHIHITFV